MSCSTKKVEHQTVIAAQAHADSIFRKDGHQPNVYVCPECGFFHVGGGRASDRPVKHLQQTRTPWREQVQRKIDKGKTLTVDDLILEKLISTFDSDTEIANSLGCDVKLICEIRHTLNVPKGGTRKREAIEKRLLADPSYSRKQLAMEMQTEPTYVSEMAVKLGLKGRVRRPRGPASPNFARVWTAESRAKRGSLTKAYMAAHPDFKPHIFTDEERTRSIEAQRARPMMQKRKGEKLRRRWQNAETRTTIVARMKEKANDPALLKMRSEQMRQRMQDPNYKQKVRQTTKARWQDPAYRAKMSLAARRSNASRFVSPHDGEILSLLPNSPLTFKQIAGRFGLTEAHVSGIARRAGIKRRRGPRGRPSHC